MINFLWMRARNCPPVKMITSDCWILHWMFVLTIPHTCRTRICPFLSSNKARNLNQSNYLCLFFFPPSNWLYMFFFQIHTWLPFKAILFLRMGFSYLIRSGRIPVFSLGGFLNLKGSSKCIYMGAASWCNSRGDVTKLKQKTHRRPSEGVVGSGWMDQVAQPGPSNQERGWFWYIGKL